ncbi:MAG: polysaccharide biosynthesis protein [Gammaproteobacteria bacterium]|nr:polysaccharide biosynthesis protein [Gammaproteobacteria bacterium]NIT41139.1 polysaccharide biosynthesis protein [Gammaproteobacteria bacterium]
MVINNQWENTSVLITGVCGTVGQELLRQVLEQNADRIVGIDNDESDLFFLSQLYSGHENVHLFYSDIRDANELITKMRGIDVVLHAAALKHVFLCERAPYNAIQTNILGTQNIIDAAYTNQVKRVLFTSSDKAVNPTNVMGTSKLMGERLVTAANAQRQSSDDPIFASSRFGNVLGSSGSVIPIFHEQIRLGGPVTLTDAGMTRFIMTLEQAVRLVMESVFLACGGEVFVTKMPVVRIADLAEVMIEELASESGHKPKNIEITTIGSKPGEKLYEELMNEEEIRRSAELDKFFVILPAFKSLYEQIDYRYPDEPEFGIKHPYNSALIDPMSKDELRSFLNQNNLLRGE